jgi:hypothetical protein
MRVRTIISLEREHLRALKARARARGVPLAELMRELIAESLTGDRPPTAISPAAFEQIVGMGESGCDDIAARHDARLADALRAEADDRRRP